MGLMPARHYLGDMEGAKKMSVQKSFRKFIFSLGGFFLSFVASWAKKGTILFCFSFESI